MESLREFLRGIHHQSYKAYKGLRGWYRFPCYSIYADHVQGDPFALPSRFSIQVSAGDAGFPEAVWNTPQRRIACEDYVGRAVARAIARHVRGRRGSGNSGKMAIAGYGQQVLMRNAVLLSSGGIEARITIGLPAALRRADGIQAEAMFFDELPRVVEDALIFDNLPSEALFRHVDSVDDQAWLRQRLERRGLVAFIADGSVLPRRSGIDDRPLEAEALPLRSPESLKQEFTLPHAGPVAGLGIPKGVTLIAGGGFHGKSTLLHALERGVYDHIPGDGREKTVTDATAVKIRAEDGRAISNVDISGFIDNLPFGRDTHDFDTENASGSTSQAANIIEALQTGAKVLLIDEDTSATNFMIRDERMRQLVSKDKEPITPFLHRVRELYERHGVSTVIVMGGSGEYLRVADTVVMMDNYQPREVTEQARRIGAATGPVVADGPLPALTFDSARHPVLGPDDSSDGRRDINIKVREVSRCTYGARDLDLSKLEQLVDMGQTEAIGWMLHYYALHFGNSEQGLFANLRELHQRVIDGGLDILCPWKVGSLALPRLNEAAGAINRMRGLRWA